MKSFSKWFVLLLVLGAGAWLLLTPSGKDTLDYLRERMAGRPAEPEPEPVAEPVLAPEPEPPVPEPVVVDLSEPEPAPVVAAPEPPPPPTLEEIAADRENWPRELTIAVPVSFPVILNGLVAGSAETPAGTRVKLVAMAKDRVQVEFNQGRAAMAASDTDLVERYVETREAIAREKAVVAERLQAIEEQDRLAAQSQPGEPAAPEAQKDSGKMVRPTTAVALSGASKPAAASGEKPMWGVYVGNNPDGVGEYEKWLGAKADAVLGYTGDASWQDYMGSVGWATGLWKDLDRTILWSVPLIPKEATLEEAATGAYNDKYEEIARKLAKFRPQEKVLYIRTAWEFNGEWFHYNAIGKEEAFIGAWRQFVTSFRKVSDRFRFDWCPNFGQNPSEMDPANAYPGDEYVDVIGLDIYDEMKWNKIEDPRARWKFVMEARFGLEWHRNFAKKHGKPMSYPEWGTGWNDSGDNPYFVEQMHKWFVKNNVLYATYWFSNANYHAKLDDERLAEAAAMYKKVFGKGGGSTSAEAETATGMEADADADQASR